MAATERRGPGAGPWQVFVESNTTGTGRRFATIAAELGLRPLMLVSDASRYPWIAEDGLACVELDTGDRHAIRALCAELQEREGLAGVGSSSEYFIETSAAVARELGLAGPDPDAVALARDKLAQRERLRAAGVGSPDFRVAHTREEALEAARALGYPLVAKPREGSGSIGVRLCSDEAELLRHLGPLLERTCNERGIPVATGALLEAAVEGPEFSVELFDGCALALVRKHLGRPPFFVEIGHDHPAGVAEQERELLEREAERAAEALGLGYGPIHAELRLAPEGPRIIELNPRLAGGWIPEMLRLSSGIDLVEASVRRMAGLSLRLERTLDRCASIRFLLLGDSLRTEALDDARRLPGVAEVTLYPPRPDVRAPQGDFRDRVGHVVTVAETLEEAAAAAALALGVLRGRAQPSTGGAPEVLHG